MSVVPKTTQPLTKFIRTLEGWLVIVFNGVLAGAATFGELPTGLALKWGGIVTTAAVIARSGLKAIAALNPALVPPADPTISTGVTFPGIGAYNGPLPSDAVEAKDVPPVTP